jgi:hypothetical protein
MEGNILVTNILELSAVIVTTLAVLLMARALMELYMD